MAVFTRMASFWMALPAFRDAHAAQPCCFSPLARFWRQENPLRSFVVQQAWKVNADCSGLVATKIRIDGKQKSCQALCWDDADCIGYTPESSSGFLWTRYECELFKSTPPQISGSIPKDENELGLNTGTTRCTKKTDERFESKRRRFQWIEGRLYGWLGNTDLAPRAQIWASLETSRRALPNESHPSPSREKFADHLWNSDYEFQIVDNETYRFSTVPLSVQSENDEIFRGLREAAKIDRDDLSVSRQHCVLKILSSSSSKSEKDGDVFAVETLENLPAYYEFFLIESKFYMRNRSTPKLGAGSYGDVYSVSEMFVGNALLTNNKQLVLKTILKRKIPPEAFAKMKNEIELNRRLEHDNIARFVGAIENKSAFYIVMENAGNNLHEYLYGKDGRAPPRLLPANDIEIIVKRILRALQYMHSQNIAHRDLKLENVLINGMVVDSIKLIDFGFARDFGCRPLLNKTASFFGTDVYLPPEVITHWYHDADGFGVDLWSLGVLTYELCTGREPFPGGVNEVVRRCAQYDNRPLKRRNMPEMEMLVWVLLQNNAADRLPAEKILDVIEKPGWTAQKLKNAWTEHNTANHSIPVSCPAQTAP